MLKIGHRGAKGYVAENTLASFAKAIALGCDGIELDVQFSKDAIPVVIHDATVNRTTTANGLVSDFTFSELKNLGIPTLEEVLLFVNKRCFINIEIKNAAATNAVLQLLDVFISDKKWDINLFLLSSFDWNILTACHLHDPQISIGVLTENNLQSAILFAQQIQAHSINPYFKLLTTDGVFEMKKNKFKIYPYTVNHQEDLTFVKQFGIDGIISDFPDRI